MTLTGGNNFEMIGDLKQLFVLCRGLRPGWLGVQVRAQVPTGGAAGERHQAIVN